MIIQSAFIIFLGMLFLAVKLPIRTTLKLLGRHLVLDIGVSALALILHWGTFSGVMAAAGAGLLCSVTTTLARWSIGYIVGNKYTPGKLLNLNSYLKDNSK